MKCDDDTFVFMDNLRSFLSAQNASSATSYGYHFYQKQMKAEFLSGGAGYVMSRESFQRLGAQLRRDAAACPNTGKEDVNTFQCLERLGSRIGKSVDRFGRERFHPLSVEDHWYGRYPDWMAGVLNREEVVKVSSWLGQCEVTTVARVIGFWLFHINLCDLILINMVSYNFTI